jgi:hypothetical protein
MQGNIVTAARWLFAGMVASTALLVAGLFVVVHGEQLCPWLFRTGAQQRPCCTLEEPAGTSPAGSPSF